MEKSEYEKKLLLSKCEDLSKRAKKSGEALFSAFLDPSERAYIKRNLKAPAGVEYDFSGGFPDAERSMFFAHPDWEEDVSVPISAVLISSNGKEELTHRDFLGSVMGLGISREVVGDILVKEENALVFLKEDIAEYIIYNLTSIGRARVKCSLYEGDLDEFIKKEVKEEAVNVSSLRLDCVIAGAYRVSRTVSSELVRQGRVKVNFEECFKNDLKLNDGDLISVRGFGRIRYLGISGTSKKGRLYIDIERYV